MIETALLARKLDKGTLRDFLLGRAGACAELEGGLQAEAGERLGPIVAGLLEMGDIGGKGRFFSELRRSFNREMRLAIALHAGNEGSFQALLLAEGWTAEQVGPVLQSLCAEEWRAVQAIWDFFADFRPEIAARQKRLYGTEPEWLQARPMGLHCRTAAGEPAEVALRGGYYPLRAGTLAAESGEGIDTSSVSRCSFLRQSVPGRPMCYSLAGLYGGAFAIIHDLVWHETLIDFGDLLDSATLRMVVGERYGPGLATELHRWLKLLAGADAAAFSGLQAAERSMQGRSVAAGLCFHALAGLLADMGFIRAAARIGPVWVGRGLRRFAGHTDSAMAEASGLFSTLRLEPAAAPAGRDGPAAWLDHVRQAVATVLWLAVFEKALDAGSSAESASAEADSLPERLGLGLFAADAGGFTQLHADLQELCGPEGKPDWAEDLCRAALIPALADGLRHALLPADGDDWQALADKLLAEGMADTLDIMMAAQVLNRSRQLSLSAV